MSTIPSATRPAAVAGLFYPAPPDALRSTVRAFLDQAATAAPPAPKVLIVPHAGYVYSGAVAAHAHAALRAVATTVQRVVLIGPAHRVAVRGLAVPTAARFATPLGEVDVDRTAVDALDELPTVVVSDRAHAAEHALEVQLPFLQVALERFAIVPIVAGAADPDEVADVLERVWGGPETLIVVSSDLSHYLPYEAARRVDRATVDQVLALGPELDHQQACGATPINGLMALARRRGLKPRLLAACSSGDTAGDRDRVVGYASFAFDAPPDAVVLEVDGDVGAQDERDGRGETLLAHARHAIETIFGPARSAVPPAAPFLDLPGATFVTLRRHGELRGCVGSLEAERTLREDVTVNARAAALRDPRFAPLTPSELDGLTIEVSLLSAPQPLAVADEADLAQRLRVRVDGVVLEYGRRRATFLPQVWDELPDARDFLRHLKAKAGLPPGFWSAEIRVSRYAVRKWSER